MRTKEVFVNRKNFHLDWKAEFLGILAVGGGNEGLERGGGGRGLPLHVLHVDINIGPPPTHRQV